MTIYIYIYIYPSVYNSKSRKCGYQGTKFNINRLKKRKNGFVYGVYKTTVIYHRFMY